MKNLHYSRKIVNKTGKVEETELKLRELSKKKGIPLRHDQIM